MWTQQDYYGVFARIPREKPQYMPSKGVFLLDIEVELAWGMIDEKMNKRKVRNASKKVRIHLEDVIHLLERYEVPVTWGILGHVILDRCDCRSGVPHPEMPRPSYTWMKRDWYEHDPCKELSEEPAFYGRDITDKIVHYMSQIKIPHDIACHSFSHQLFGDPGCSREVAEAEVKRCIELIEENYHIKPKVFIFPRDYPGHLDVLQKNGIIAFRGRIPHAITYSESGGGVSNSLRKYACLANHWTSFYLATPPPVVTPMQEHGLINIPASMSYNKKPFIPLRLITSKAKKGIEKAIEKREIFHLYTHLMNFGEVSNVKKFFEGFEEILSCADLGRRRDELETTTIRRLAETV